MSNYQVPCHPQNNPVMKSANKEDSLIDTNEVQADAGKKTNISNKDKKPLRKDFIDNDLKNQIRNIFHHYLPAAIDHFAIHEPYLILVYPLGAKDKNSSPKNAVQVIEIVELFSKKEVKKIYLSKKVSLLEMVLSQNLLLVTYQSNGLDAFQIPSGEKRFSLHDNEKISQIVRLNETSKVAFSSSKQIFELDFHEANPNPKLVLKFEYEIKSMQFSRLLQRYLVLKQPQTFTMPILEQPKVSEEGKSTFMQNLLKKTQERQLYIIKPDWIGKSRHTKAWIDWDFLHKKAIRCFEFIDELRVLLIVNEANGLEIWKLDCISNRFKPNCIDFNNNFDEIKPWKILVAYDMIIFKFSQDDSMYSCGLHSLIKYQNAQKVTNFQKSGDGDFCKIQDFNVCATSKFLGINFTFNKSVSDRSDENKTDACARTKLVIINLSYPDSTPMLLSTKDDLKTVSFICNPAGNNAYLLSKNCRLLELKLGNLQRRSHRILDQAEDLLVDSEIFEKNKVPENSFACHDGESLFIYIHTDSSLENFNKNHQQKDCNSQATNFIYQIQNCTQQLDKNNKQKSVTKYKFTENNNYKILQIFEFEKKLYVVVDDNKNLYVSNNSQEPNNKDLKAQKNVTFIEKHAELEDNCYSAIFFRARGILIVGLKNSIIALYTLHEINSLQFGQNNMATKAKSIQQLHGHKKDPFQFVINETRDLLFSLSSEEIISWSMNTFSMLKYIQVQLPFAMNLVGDSLIAIEIRKDKIMNLAEQEKESKYNKQNNSAEYFQAQNQLKVQFSKEDEQKNSQIKTSTKNTKNSNCKSILFFSQKDLSISFSDKSKLLDNVDKMFYLAKPATLIIQRKKRFVFYSLSAFFTAGKQNELCDCNLETLSGSPKNDLFYTYTALSDRFSCGISHKIHTINSQQNITDDNTLRADSEVKIKQGLNQNAHLEDESESCFEESQSVIFNNSIFYTNSSDEGKISNKASSNNVASHNSDLVGVFVYSNKLIKIFSKLVVINEITMRNCDSRNAFSSGNNNELINNFNQTNTSALNHKLEKTAKNLRDPNTDEQQILHEEPIFDVIFFENTKSFMLLCGEKKLRKFHYCTFNENFTNFQANGIISFLDAESTYINVLYDKTNCRLFWITRDGNIKYVKTDLFINNLNLSHNQPQIANAKNMKQLDILGVHKKKLRKFMLISNQQIIFSHCRRNVLKIWDSSSLILIQIIPNFEPFNSISINKTREIVIICNNFSKVILINLHTLEKIACISNFDKNSIPKYVFTHPFKDLTFLVTGDNKLGAKKFVVQLGAVCFKEYNLLERLFIEKQFFFPKSTEEFCEVFRKLSWLYKDSELLQSKFNIYNVAIQKGLSQALEPLFKEFEQPLCSNIFDKNIVDEAINSGSESHLWRVLKFIEENNVQLVLSSSSFEFLIKSRSLRYHDFLANRFRIVTKFTSDGDTIVREGQFARDITLLMEPSNAFEFKAFNKIPIKRQSLMTSQIKIYDFLLRWDFESHTDTNLEFLEAITESPSDRLLLSHFSYIIELKWKKYFFAFSMLAVVIWLHLITYFVALCNLKHTAFFYFDLVLLILLLCYELLSIIANPKKYFKSIYNILDLFMIGSNGGVLISLLSNVQQMENLGFINFVVLSLALLSFRGFTYFKVLPWISYVARMTSIMVAKSLGMISLVFYFIICFSVILNIANGLNSLETSILINYRMLFGDIPENFEDSFYLNKIILILASFLLAIFMLNFLIAKLSGAYSELQIRQKVLTCKEKAQALYEIESLHNLIFRLYRFLSKPSLKAEIEILTEIDKKFQSDYVFLAVKKKLIDENKADEPTHNESKDKKSNALDKKLQMFSKMFNFLEDFDQSQLILTTKAAKKKYLIKKLSEGFLKQAKIQKSNWSLWNLLNKSSPPTTEL